MNRKNKNWKIAAVAIFFVLVAASAVQAVVKINNYREEEFVPFDIMRLLEGEGKSSSTWEDFFNDESKIDTSPPGQGQSDNYVVEGGEVKTINTYDVWTDPDWTRMKPITITNNGGTDDYVINFTVAYDPDMQSDYDDIRFKHEESPTTWLDYWIEYYDTSSATVWVEVPSLTSGESEMYLFYGNPSATSQSDFYDIFSWENVWSDDEKITVHLPKEGAWDPDVSYGNGEFLVAWEEGQYALPPWTWGIKQEIRASIYEPDGTRIVFDKRVFNDGTTYYRNEDPSIAYGTDRWFVSWQHYEPVANPDATTMDIKARWIKRNGDELQLGSVIDVCDASNRQADSNVQFDSINDQFCVAWEDGRNGFTNYNIYARLYDDDGSPVGNEVIICDDANCQFEPWIAFDNINEQYMIVWEEAEDWDVGPFSLKAGLFDAEDLDQIGNTIDIADATSDTDYIYPCVEFCEETECFLITYNDGDLSATPKDYTGNVSGIILDTTGGIVEETFQIRSGEYTRTDIVPYTDTLFFVSYDGDGYIQGKLVSSEGDVFSGELQISSSGDADEANLAVGDGEIFVAWEDTRVDYSYPWDDNPDVYGNIWYLDMSNEGDISYIFDNEKDLILSAHVTSINIEPEALSSWDEFIEESTLSDSIVFDILDGNTGIMILHNISNGYDISGIAATSIRLKATFTRTNPSSSPAIDMWGVSYYTNSPPNTPSNPSPANGATSVEINADLSWIGGDPDPGDTVTYDVYFGDSSSPPKVVGNQSVNTYEPGALNFGTTYYWKIVAWDNHGATTEGPIWSFTTKYNNPPNTPSSPSPPNAATNVNLNADLSWSGGDPDGDNVTYDVYFGVSSSPPKVITNQSGTTYDPGTLNYNTTYYWKIVAWDEHGATTSGPIWHFTTRANHPPNTPSNPSPANGVTNVDIDEDLSWTGGDPDPGDSVTYDIYFGTSSPPPVKLYGHNKTTYDPETMEYDTTYYWKIVAWDSFGESSPGPIWHFTTKANSPPNTPSNPSPANGEINVDLNEDLNWTGGDPDGDSVTYNVYFEADDPTPDVLVSENQSDTSYDPGTMEFGTTYYWQIEAWDSYGLTTTGPIWSFTTEYNNPPNTPSSPSPANGATNVQLNVELSWTGGDPDGHDVYYDVYFGDSSPPSKIIANQSGTTYDPGILEFSTTYYWQIVAWDEYGATASGPVWEFTTGTNNAPNTPSNPNPANGAVNIPVSTDLSWIGGDPDPEDTVAYDVYFGDSNPPQKISANQSEESYSFTNDLSENTTYYWKIFAWDNHGQSTPGPLWQFKTIESFNQPPNTPSIWGDGQFPGFQFIQPNVEYTFTVVASDSDGDDVYYWIDWGDDTNSGWLGPYHTSVPITQNHTWTETLDIQVIQVKAKDIHGAESGWGKLWIIIIKNENVPLNYQVVKNNMQTIAQNKISVNQDPQSNPSGTLLGQTVTTTMAATRSKNSI